MARYENTRKSRGGVGDANKTIGAGPEARSALIFSTDDFVRKQWENEDAPERFDGR